ncbi:vacuolar protein sorting-associated protein 45 [Vanrija albida]|uniref:Vacuolar protein sorting-associated protein 45 n=1 Tax=Vanrija albida TaxID=181172 RepID=A0ABR3Q8Z7_9TREE
MDVLKAVQTYVLKMITEVPGMKVLLLDAHTTPIVSLVTTQSELLSHEVYLTDRIDNASREPLSHLNCIAFLTPSDRSIELLKQELAKPRYGGYWLFFSNVLQKSQIEDMATVDEFEVVKEVQPPLYLPPPDDIPPPVLDNHLRAILAVLLSLKKRPVIRWERMSASGYRLAQDLHGALNHPPYRDLFEFRSTAGPTPQILILDRRNDPVTPLLSQWTYEAMVHELLGINNGRVHIPTEERQELRDLVLNASSDPFFADNLYANFGDLGASLSQYVTDYSSKSSTIGNVSSSRIETVADMKRFVEEYPEFRKLGGNVSKHVTLVGELSRIVERDDLLAVSEVEQSLASQESHQTDLRSVMTLIASPKVPAANKLRLAILYALRYQKFYGNQITAVVDALIKNNVGADRARLVYVMLNFAGADVRQDDLFMNENFFSRGKSAIKGLKGVENVYTQHTPHLLETLDLLLKGRLTTQSYPFIEGDEAARTQRPQDIIVFMLGGTTYEEASAVALLNQRLASDAAGGPGGTRILLGGSTIHNSASFLDMVSKAAETWPESMYQAPAGLSAGASTIAPTPAPAAAGPSLNLRAGGYELSVGGAGGSGLYRAGTGEVGGNLSLGSGPLAQVGEGLRDGAGRLWGNVRQRMEERASRSNTPPR